jgi:hypothetical protein
MEAKPSILEGCVDVMAQDALVDWLTKWCSRQSSVIVLRSAVGERFSADEGWTSDVHERALAGCARALERVRGTFFIDPATDPSF